MTIVGAGPGVLSDEVLVEWERTTENILLQDPRRLDRFLYPENDLIGPLISDLDLRRQRALSGVATKQERDENGPKLEHVCTAAFSRLSGAQKVLSYTTPGPQIDLLVRGGGPLWDRLLRGWHVGGGTRDAILLEAKATKGPVEDQQFARFCAVLDAMQTIAIGVFVTFSGASGFKKRGVFAQCRLRQLMHYVRTSVPIVVLDWSDIAAFARPGGLVSVIRSKVEAIDELRLAIPTSVSAPGEIELPPEHSSYLPERLRNRV